MLELLWGILLKISGGSEIVRLWLTGFLVTGFVAALWTGFFKARKIQPRGFKWKIFRNEAIFAAINMVASGFLIGLPMAWLSKHGLIVAEKGPVEWWRIALEYVAYFFLFDTWFYWLHRWMHREPMYTYIHKLHHFSTAPNLLTTLSVNPIESLINGGFVPIFLATMTLIHPVHAQSMALITPTNILMGLYVHSGYEFFPRWWNRSWATKWFITATFHDHHHKYFNYNFGGYTTIWDRICGTMRKNFEKDFEAIAGRTRPVKAAQSIAPTV